ncbi:ankyrin repeat domain-containing protein [Tuwongella immobilis]
MPIEAELVKAFVIAAHKDLEEVKKLLAAKPGLVNACWDWGGGDFESALGGAAHTGQREIAEFLIAKGARLDIFAAAMLGKLDVVKAMVTAFPGIEKTPGPHGIPLIVHAKMGREPAADVLKFLESLQPKKAT